MPGMYVKSNVCFPNITLGTYSDGTTDYRIGTHYDEEEDQPMFEYVIQNDTDLACQPYKEYKDGLRTRIVFPSIIGHEYMLALLIPITFVESYLKM